LFKEDAMKVYRLSERDLTEYKTSDGAGKLAVCIKTPNITAGFTRFEKGTATATLRNWPYWYDEVVYITRGKGKITHADPPFTSPEAHEVQAGDLLYIPKGSKVTFEALSNEPFDLLYITHPDPGFE
jgi:ethanolamine utilization protein EutQ (cupin superfamily)